jgi:copper chaperone CopZ
METTTFTVIGMTCEHCVRAVTQELQALPGVHDVNVDLPSGGVAVTSDEPLDDDAVRGAVDEAGYVVSR